MRQSPFPPGSDRVDASKNLGKVAALPALPLINAPAIVTSVAFVTY
jgi:hypothetical protein